MDYLSDWKAAEDAAKAAREANPLCDESASCPAPDDGHLLGCRANRARLGLLSDPSRPTADQQADELRELLTNATPGPWTVAQDADPGVGNVWADGQPLTGRFPDYELVVWLRNHAEELAAVLDRLAASEQAKEQAEQERDRAVNGAMAERLRARTAEAERDRLAAALVIAVDALGVAGEYVLSIADEVTTRRPDVQAKLEAAIQRVEAIVAREALSRGDA